MLYTVFPNAIIIGSEDFKSVIFKYPLSPNQKSEWSADQKVLLVELELYIGPEIVSELLRFGSSVKVTYPNQLKEMVLEALNDTLELY